MDCDYAGGKPENVDGENYYIRDGVVVVPKGAVISDGTLNVS
jgi:glucose-1-phosphate adenylyltransferase